MYMYSIIRGCSFIGIKTCTLYMYKTVHVYVQYIQMHVHVHVCGSYMWKSSALSHTTTLLYTFTLIFRTEAGELVDTCVD